MGSRSRAKREAGRDGDGDNPPGTITLLELAESLTSLLAKDLDSDSLRRGKSEGALVSSAVADIVINGRRRKVHLPADLFDASRDLQVGCVYGALMRMTKAKSTMCVDCRKVSQDLFSYKDKSLSKMPQSEGSRCQ